MNRTIGTLAAVVALTLAACGSGTSDTTTTIPTTTTTDTRGWSDEAFRDLMTYCQATGAFASCAVTHSALQIGLALAGILAGVGLVAILTGGGLIWASKEDKEDTATDVQAPDTIPENLIRDQELAKAISKD
ncbi:MAG: hypothetical protein IH818_11490 [Acidobacteria bacterium]|nr:hypothetical protein [Acidobacteriota bacterium]